MFQGFKKFILRGNVVDLAVGVVIGAAFNNMVQALVKDIITPIIGAIAKVPDFSNLSFAIRGSEFAYGDFLNNLISFLLVAVSIYFFVVVPVNSLLARFKKDEPIEPPKTKKCPECKSDIAIDATRCPHCTIKIE